jgi:hypothetical protein
MKKIIYFFLFIFFGFVLNSCFEYNDGWGPCSGSYPRPSNDLSQIIILKNSDTIKIIKDFSWVIAYNSISTSTLIELDSNYYNDCYHKTDRSGFLLKCVYNGCGIGEFGEFDIINATITFPSNNCLIDNCLIDTTYYLLNDSLSTKIHITKNEDVWGLVEGHFSGNFVYEKDTISDTIFVSCKFSAFRWCDGGNDRYAP